MKKQIKKGRSSALDIPKTDSTNSNEFENKILQRENTNFSKNSYVALRTDVISSNGKVFFMGQIGHVGSAMNVDTSTEDCYIIYFYDEIREYKDPDNSCSPIALPILSKDSLIKLHFKLDERLKLGTEQMGYDSNVVLTAQKEGNEILENSQVDLDSFLNTEDLFIDHDEISKRFDVGKLVTIVYDFVINQNKNPIIILSGQVGMIKDQLPNNYVSVVFREVNFQELILDPEQVKKIKKISKMSKLRRNKTRVIETKIHKSFLLALYYTDLKLSHKGREQLQKLGFKPKTA